MLIVVYHTSLPESVLLPVSRRPSTTQELSQLQREYDQVEQEWRKWLCHNLSHFGTIENSWYAFKAQWQGQTSFLEIDAVFRGYE
jgi:hypothetical protein